MSYTPDKLVSFATRFEQISEESLEKSAKKKEKVDPKAKVRNRGSVCVPAESAKDKKDHFPINNEAQARNALARVHQYSSTPEWYSGSLKGLQALVARKVKAKYPKIDVGGKDSAKKKSAYYETVLEKLGQKTTDRTDPAYYDDPPKPQDPFNMGGQKPAVDPNNPFADYLKQNPLNAPQVGDHSVNPNIGTSRKNYWSDPAVTDQGPAPTATTQTPAPTTQAPAASKPKIPVRADVKAAQIQFNKWNKENGNLVAPLAEDGQLGTKTRTAFHGYRPGVDVESIVKDLSEQGMTWNTRTPPKPQPGVYDPKLGF